MLIDSLKNLQLTEGLTDQEFADKLGIHRVSWHNIKNYRKTFGKRFLMAVRQNYPELHQSIDIFLAGDATERHNNATTINTTNPEPSPEPKLARFRSWLICGILSLVKRR